MPGVGGCPHASGWRTTPIPELVVGQGGDTDTGCVSRAGMALGGGRLGRSPVLAGICFL